MIPNSSIDIEKDSIPSQSKAHAKCLVLALVAFYRRCPPEIPLGLISPENYRELRVTLTPPPFPYNEKGCSSS